MLSERGFSEILESQTEQPIKNPTPTPEDLDLETKLEEGEGLQTEGDDDIEEVDIHSAAQVLLMLSKSEPSQVDTQKFHSMWQGNF